MQAYNSILRYFFPLLFFLQYVGCDSYRSLTEDRRQEVEAVAKATDAAETIVEVVEYDCTDVKKYTYNGFYKPSAKGKLFIKQVASYTVDSLTVAAVPVIDLTMLKSVSKGYDTSMGALIEIILTEKGAQLFKEYTANNVGKKLAIIVRDELITAPIIHSEIPEGRVQISGNFTQQEADDVYKYLDKLMQCANP